MADPSTEPPRADLDVVAVGNAIVDVLARAEDQLLKRLELVKGSMRLIELDEAEHVYAAMGPVTEVSGGSAANTVAGVAALGGTAGLLARVADDALGALYIHDLVAAGVAFAPRAGHVVGVGGGAGGPAAGPGTGRSLILVTPDGERTMNTYLGAGAWLGPQDVDVALVDRARVAYLEGYLWDSPSAVEALGVVLATARAAGAKVALSLSDPSCVERHGEAFRGLVTGPLGTGVDVVFANEDEVRLLFGTDDFDRAVEAVRATGRLGVLTRGAAGSVVVEGDETVEAPAWPVPAVVDTTGAGDLYAAGFLRGLTVGSGLETCARLGSLAAGEVIGHLGARPQAPLSVLARQAGLLA